MNPLRPILDRLTGRRRLSAPEARAAARAKRARDHLERKRDQQRVRLERDRTRQEVLAHRRRLLRVLSPVAFAGAAFLGAKFAVPVAEFTLLGDARLERIAVQGAHALPVSSVAATTGAIAGVPLDTVDPGVVVAALEIDPWIEEAEAMRLPTGTLVVRIVERDAIARWNIEGDLAFVDATGHRFEGSETEAEALPTVTGDSALPGALPDGAREILDEITKHAPFAADPEALTLHLPKLATDAEGVLRDDPSGFVLQIGEEGPRAILGRRLLSQRVARLAALLDHDEDTARTARLIDLRYADRAVLRTETARVSGPNGFLSASG